MSWLIILALATVSVLTEKHNTTNETLSETTDNPSNATLSETTNTSNATLSETTDASNTTQHSPNVQGRQLFPGLFGLPTPFPVLSGNVAFSVRKANQNLRAFTRVYFRDVLTNIGSAWNPVTSEFIAPFNGGYYFAFHAVGSRTTDFTIALTKNGEYQVTAYGTRTSFEQGSNSAFLELRHLDRVALDLQQGMIYEHPAEEAYTSFTGFLLFRT